MWAALVVGVLLPTLAFLPLKKPGEKPDTPSLGSVFFVLWMAGALAVVTLVNAGVFARALNANWVYKVLLVIVAGSAVAVGAYYVAAALATDQNRRAMSLWATAAALIVAANLWLLWFGLSRPPASVPAPGQAVVWVLLGLAAIPVAYYAFMVLFGFVLLGLEKFKR
jgi:uncharacterized membrane-anchored protein